MGKTKIEWSEFTWNPVTGCSHAGTPGCDMCYARRMARRLAGRYGYPEYPHHFDVTLHPDRLDVPLRRKKPTTYFVCSMSDLFHEDVSDEFIDCVFFTIREAPQHIFQILTKRPARMLNWVKRVESVPKANFEATFPNVWLGISCENQATADERIPLLLQTPAAVRFVSCEPLLESVNLESYLPCPYCGGTGTIEYGYMKGFQCACEGRNSVTWTIIGGESGTGARPMHPDWARGLRDQCWAAGVPFYFKQRGAWTWWDPGEPIPTVPRYQLNDGLVVFHVGKKRAGRLLDGREWNEMPEVL